jgi:glycerophosphoryl diester phosphodiesterase
VLIIGHRGAPRLARENTVESFRAARAAGADMVELDVRRTAEGEMAVHHDAALDDGRLIVDLLAPELPDWVPDLDEALDASVGMSVNIEIKNWQRDPDFDHTELLAVAVADLVDRRGDHDRVVVSSFNLATIARVRAIDDRIATGWLTFPGLEMTPLIEVAHEGGHNAIHPFDHSVTADAVGLAHAAGLQVNVWTVDDEDRMRELDDFGVDGLVTNVPDVAARVLRGR